MNDRLTAALRQRGLDWRAPIEHHAALGSTNDRIKDLARSGAPEWTVVVADRQDAGRGRHGRRWVSPAGGLYLSTLLRPRFEAVSLIPLAAGLGVAEALEEFGVSTELKWPNDVVAAGGKLAGVLAEAASGGGAVEWVALGVGINVESVDWDPARAPQATSLAALGARVELSALAAAVLARLSACYDALRVGALAVVAAWRSRALPWWGHEVEFDAGGETLRGRLVEVDGRGALVIELPDGRRSSLLSGEVGAVRRAGEERGA